MLNAAFGQGSGPIFLEGLNCEQSDTRILDCGISRPPGLANCMHADDAGVICRGMHINISESWTISM